MAGAGRPLYESCRALAHDHRRRRKEIQRDGLSLPVHLPELEHAGGTHLDAGRAAHALGVLHGLSLVREVHHVDALVADRGADLSLIHISEPTRQAEISYAVF